MKRFISWTLGRYSRPRRAGLRFRANALFIITMEREEKGKKLKKKEKGVRI